MVSRRTFIGPIVLLAIVVVGYPAYWLYAAALGRDLVSTFIDDHRRDGFVINHGTIERSGFPLLVRIEIAAPEARNPSKTMSWRSETLHLEMQPWNLQRIRLEAGGGQSLRVVAQADGLDLTANTARFAGVAQIGSGGDLTALSLELREVRLAEAERGRIFETDRILADIARPDRPPIAHTETAFELSLSADDIALAKVDAPLLGKTIANMRVKAEVLGPFEETALPHALSDWRNAGGTIEVRWLNLVWGALDLRANGTMALDTDMRPLGALTADIRGYEQALEAMAEAGLLRRNILPASRVALNLLAKTDATDGRKVLTVPLTAQDGALFLGPIKLSDLPAVIRPDRRRPSPRRG